MTISQNLFGHSGDVIFRPTHKEDGRKINKLAENGVDKSLRDSCYCDAMQARLFSQTSVVAIEGKDVRGAILGFIPQDSAKQDVYVPWKIVTAGDLSEAEALKLCADMLTHVFSRSSCGIKQVEIPGHIFALGHNGVPNDTGTLTYLSQHIQPGVERVEYIRFSDRVNGMADELHGLVAETSLDDNSPHTYRILMRYFIDSCYLYGGDGSKHALYQYDSEDLLSGAVVGFKIPGANRGFLWQVGVHPDFQRRGIGPEIIHRWTERMIKRYGIEGFKTTVVPSKTGTSTRAFQTAVRMLRAKPGFEGARLDISHTPLFTRPDLRDNEEEDLLNISFCPS